MTSQTQKLIEVTKAQVELIQAQTSAYQEEIESLRNKMEILTQAYNALSHTQQHKYTHSPPHTHHPAMFNHCYESMLVNVLEVFDQSMTRNNKCFQESMKL